jgi:NAD(P)-dependent dehydrogenase (short-subunit alcohol dehydrogenase family)
MQGSSKYSPKVLVTGGTSGLGLELTRIFLKKGYYVVATGRRNVDFPGYEDKFSLYNVDFNNLKRTAAVFRNICESHQFDFIINNAGILSPPRQTMTKDGLEYTFQVNFLAHLLINEIIIKNKEDNRPLKIVPITSPVYKLAKVEIGKDQSYKALKAYSDSKLFLALMCGHLTEIHPGKNILCFSFDPGVFGSGIYRMRDTFFTVLYKIASPFMREPSKVAEVLCKVLTEMEVIGGVIYDYRKRVNQLPVNEQAEVIRFWKECYNMIGPYLS